MRNLFLLFDQPIYNNLGNICNQIQRFTADKYTPFIGYVLGAFHVLYTHSTGYVFKATDDVDRLRIYSFYWVCFAAVQALNFRKYTHSTGYVSRQDRPSFASYVPRLLSIFVSVFAVDILILLSMLYDSQDCRSIVNMLVLLGISRDNFPSLISSNIPILRGMF